MAERRMFAKTITEDDNFMALSASAQALYLHLSMSADDDGFSNKVSISMFRAHASVQDLEALLEKRYIYQFDNGVIVIKHWRMCNALRKDRYTPTVFQEELKRLNIKQNGAYSMGEGDWLPDGCQTVAVCPPQDSLVKDSLVKDKEEKPHRYKYGEYSNVLLTDEEILKLSNEVPNHREIIEDLSNYMASTGKSYKPHYATVRNWARKEAKKPASKVERHKKMQTNDFSYADIEELLLKG